MPRFPVGDPDQSRRLDPDLGDQARPQLEDILLFSFAIPGAERHGPGMRALGLAERVYFQLDNTLFAGFVSALGDAGSQAATTGMDLANLQRGTAVVPEVKLPNERRAGV